MINCILGKSKTGKTTHIYNMIESDLKEGNEVILFVPSQSRAASEEEYMKILKKSGVIGVNITTISEYIASELKLQNLHIDEKYMSKLDRKIILTQVIKENEGLFNVYNKVKNYPGFLDVLDIYMDLFRKGKIEELDTSKIDVSDKMTSAKFKEIFSIYQKYIEKIKNQYIDTVGETELFLENIKKSQLYKQISNTKIYFDGYNNFSNSEFDLINMLVKNNVDITISLNTDITKIEDIFISSSIFETVNNTYKRICKIANKNNVSLENIVKYENVFDCSEDIKYIANNVFSTQDKKEKIDVENIDISMYTNVLKEVEAVAKIITEKIRQGYKYSDFAIYTTSIEDYEKVISKTMYNYNLKVYIPKNLKISDSILTKYIQSILNMSQKGINFDIIFDTLKQGLTDIAPEDIYTLENYVKEFNINKYMVSQKFTLNNLKGTYDIEALNELKDNILQMYSFVNKMDSMSCKEKISAIYTHLKENNIFKNYNNLIDEEKNGQEADVTLLDKSNFESQVWPHICEVFDSIVKVYKDEKMSSVEFANIFNLVVKDIKVKTLPPAKDQIELMDINVAKASPKKIAFFIGVVETKFPKSAEEDILFTDLELERLKEKDIDIKETSISKLNMGYFNIYEALNNIKEKLYISVPASTLDGKATRPSTIITTIKQIANVSINGNVTLGEFFDDDISKISSKDELFMWLISKIKDLDILDNISNVYSVYKYFSEDKEYSKILEYKKDDSALSREITDIIYSDEFKSSVSKLELYKKCPFSYFMQYILKINVQKESRKNVLETGSFMHEVLESFSKRIFEKNVGWSDILQEDEEKENIEYELKPEYEAILEDIIYESIDKNLSRQKQSVKYMLLRRKLIHTMKRVIKTVALSFCQSDFTPLGYEIEFRDDSVFLPMEIKLANDKTMKIIGKIDRVDMLNFKDAMYIRVVDYKSSGKDLKIDNIKEGLSLQLVSYMMAFMNNKKNEKIVPAAMVYFNLSDRLLTLPEYEQDNEKIKSELLKRLKMNGIFLKDMEILNKMDKNFENSKESLIDVTKQSVTRNSSKVLDEKEFESLCENTKNILSQIGTELSSGNVKICPNKKENYCQFCDYSQTCRKNIKV